MRLHCQNLLRDAAWRTFVLGSATVVTTVWKKNDDNNDRRDSSVYACRSEPRLGFIHKISLPSFLSPTVCFSEAEQKRTLLPALVREKRRNAVTQRVRKKVYDFVVIGNGNAGRSAVENLQKQCPTASIALLDPLRRPDRVGGSQQQQPVDYFGVRATRLSPNQRTVMVEDGDGDDVGSPNMISYKCAVLVATGARGAPPPAYLMDETARSLIFELRPTVLSTTSQGKNSQQQQRPILSAEDVRREVLYRAKAGAAIGVVGCGWDAVDLVIAATAASQHPLAKKKATKPTIVFGSHGPLCHVLPNYLCVAVSKRLQAKRITVLDRTLIRYISYGNRLKRVTNSAQPQQQQLQVFTAKSYDLLEGQTWMADVLVIAPTVDGPRGTGTLPSDEIPEFLVETAKGRSWYQTWSSLSLQAPKDDPTLVVCYKDDGRIVVNTELCACAGVYAAGSVAKCANGRTGHATPAGVGVEDGRAAGQVAAMNMAQLYKTTTAAGGIFGFLSGDEHSLAFGFSSSDERTFITAVNGTIPVWRSDLRCSMGTRVDQVSSLADVGIVALCVGNCDSESLSTHGVWWTNQSAQRRLLALVDDELNNGPDSLQQKKQQRKTIKHALKPVYGMGVIYYIDRTGRIQGVMTWGLPFQRNHELDQRLVEQMKNVIVTNGGFRSLETDLEHMKMTQYLGDVSKKLVVSAVSRQAGNSGKAHQLDVAQENFPRPLHRFTEVRPSNVRGLGVLKRKDGHGHGVLGEDLFARYEQDDIPDTPLPTPNTTGNTGSVLARVEARYKWDVWEQKERRWDENESRARPPKEEPLWLRKGDEGRNTSQREQVAAAYNSALNPQR